MKHWLRRLAALGFSAALLVALALPAGATVMVPLDDSLLVSRAGQIVSGRVIGTQPERIGENRWLMTRVTLAVDGLLKGEAGEQVQFWVPGGTLEGRSSRISGVQSFEAGQEVMVFLRTNNTLGGLEMVGLAQGRFDLLRDTEGRRQLAARDLSGISFYKPGALDSSNPLPRNFSNARLEGVTLDSLQTLTSKIGQQAEFYDLDKFVERIRSIVAEQAAGGSRP